MAYVDQTAEEIGEVQQRIQAIVDNLKLARAEMVTEGPKVIGVDLKTALGFIEWLENWGRKVAARPGIERASANSRRHRAHAENLVKTKRKKS